MIVGWCLALINSVVWFLLSFFVCFVFVFVVCYNLVVFVVMIVGFYYRCVGCLNVVVWFWWFVCLGWFSYGGLFGCTYLCVVVDLLFAWCCFIMCVTGCRLGCLISWLSCMLSCGVRLTLFLGLFWLLLVIYCLCLLYY